KKVLIILVFLLLIPSIVGAKPQNITLKINGKVVRSDIPPFISDNRTYVPARFIGETLGMEVSYQWKKIPEAGTDNYLFVKLVGKDKRVIDISYYGVIADGICFNGYDHSSGPYLVVEDRTFVPIRFIAEALHMDVGWDEKTKTVELQSNPNREEYTLKLVTGHDQKTFRPIFTISKTHKIIWNGKNYLLEPSGLTLKEYVDQYFNKPKDSKIDKNILDLAEALHHHKYFIFYPDQKEIEGLSQR
ncbi:MAG: copper amine oxidase N-terminal domain-containing protein, partial [Tissierellia bacterium]|nr:copper amine oxidase N-terminal domain-containing protein [Tissierellia bacterium]